MSYEKLRVLVVDDEESICQVLSDSLNVYGMQVDTAMDGDEAFKLITQKRYDFVVSDVRMPKCTGIELLDKIRDYPEYTPKVIMMSAFSDLTNASAKDKGALGLLMKPQVFTELMTLIDAALEEN